MGSIRVGPYTLKYTEYGNQSIDTIILCVHGYFTNSTAFDSFVQGSLIADPLIRIVTLDLIGHGDSSRADHESEYTPAFDINSILQLIHHLGVSSVCIVGNSYGAMLGWYLIRHCHLVSKLVINDVGLTWQLAESRADIIATKIIGNIDPALVMKFLPPVLNSSIFNAAELLLYKDQILFIRGEQSTVTSQLDCSKLRLLGLQVIEIAGAGHPAPLSSSSEIDAILNMCG